MWGLQFQFEPSNLVMNPWIRKFQFETKFSYNTIWFERYGFERYGYSGNACKMMNTSSFYKMGFIKWVVLGAHKGCNINKANNSSHPKCLWLATWILFFYFTLSMATFYSQITCFHIHSLFYRLYISSTTLNISSTPHSTI